MLYTTDAEKVILVSTIPSNLALDAPVSEEKKKFNLIETEQKSHTCIHVCTCTVELLLKDTSEIRTPL